MSTPPPLRNEAFRRHELARTKLIATLALVVALLIFLGTFLVEPAYPWIPFVRATAEAALVGGLADWFAVTALFRHPLGIPIPHTAILQRHKNRVGEILGNFIQNHFLTRPVLETRLGDAQPAERIAEWLSDPDRRRLLARHLAGGLARTVESLPEPEIRALIRQGATARLESVDLAPLLGGVLEVAAADQRREELLGEVLRAVTASVRENHQIISERVHAESPRWLPPGVRDAIANRVIAAIERTLEAMNSDATHPVRKRFDAAVTRFIERIKTAPEARERLERFKHDLLGHPMVEDLVGLLWEQARGAAQRYRSDPDDSSLEPLEELLAGVSDSLANNAELQVEVDQAVTASVIALVEQHRQHVAALIAKTVAEWDPALAASRIELAVGSDLQFVRLNGTIVGGLAGLVIYSISRFF